MYEKLIDDLRQCQFGQGEFYMGNITASKVYLLGWDDGYNSRKREKGH